ncbi:hypothetical protein GWK47_046593 [Chionoecetes opilio]|uniref:Uncharacterized protein n=1 Tax=Chionoecetes opilio TaxID=41210 RepID=A0A8J5CUT2_CHIOP|nr:hypothetical protein GWK47_046593 [Chionoecetes opilio]
MPDTTTHGSVADNTYTHAAGKNLTRSVLPLGDAYLGGHQDNPCTVLDQQKLHLGCRKLKPEQSPPTWMFSAAKGYVLQSSALVVHPPSEYFVGVVQLKVGHHQLTPPRHGVFSSGTAQTSFRCGPSSSLPNVFFSALPSFLSSASASSLAFNLMSDIACLSLVKMQSPQARTRLPVPFHKDEELP